MKKEWESERERGRESNRKGESIERVIYRTVKIQKVSLKLLCRKRTIASIKWAHDLGNMA